MAEQDKSIPEDSLTKLKRAVSSKLVNHSHILYVRPDGTGTTSETNGHTHEVITKKNIVNSMSPEGEPVQEEMDGALEIQESKAPKDKQTHTHSIEELTRTEKKVKEKKDEQKIRELLGLYKDAKDLNEENLKRAEESEEFYMGEGQWEESDKAILKRMNRACLVINETKPKLDMLSGSFRQNRTDTVVMPTEKGDATTADILNINLKCIDAQNNTDYKETTTFEDMSRVGVGYMRVDIDANDNCIGNVVISNENWANVMFGQHVEFDGSDAEYVVLSKKLSKAKIKSLYPDKADEIEADWEEIQQEKDRPVSDNDRYLQEKNSDIFQIITSSNYDLVDISKKNYRLVEIQQKEYKTTPVAFNAIHNFYANLEGLSDSEIKAIKSIEEINYLTHSSLDKIRISVFCGSVLLSDKPSLFKRLNVVPFYANKIRDKFFGKVHEAKDAQRVLNKSICQHIDIVNKELNKRVGVSPDAFQSPGDAERFKESWAVPGYMPMFANGFREHIHEFRNTEYPAEVIPTVNLMSSKLGVVMNIYPEMMGQAVSNDASGKAIEKKQLTGMAAIEYLFDNFSLSKRLVGKLKLEALQIIYSPEKLLRVAENQSNKTLFGTKSVTLYPKISPEQALQLAQQTGSFPPDLLQKIMVDLQQGVPEAQKELDSLTQLMQQIAVDQRRKELVSILDNFELTEYDVVISEATHSPTMALANFAILSDLFKGNPNAPMEVLLQLVPNLDQSIKDSIISGIQSSKQAQAESEQAKNQTEIVKTQIAHANNQEQMGTPLM